MDAHAVFIPAMQPWKHAPSVTITVTYARGIPTRIAAATIPMLKDEHSSLVICDVEAWPVAPAAFERLLVECLVHWREQQLPTLGTEVHRIRWDDLMR